ncbi:MAG: penicillin-insensitive murein endopeptidase [Myxococcota bacterium]
MKALAALTLLVACAPAVPGTVVASRGDTADGWLENGARLQDRGPGFERARPGESTRFGTPRLVSALERAAADVARVHPGGAPLRIGDLSWPRGGRHPRHGSHRNGRDADLLFYATDLAGRPVPARGWVAFDREGVGVAPEEHGGDVRLFDDARNWWLVRSLLLDDAAAVQWLFVSRGLKARLLRWASRHETSRDAIFRASWVLHQPSRGNPHADHVHVRVFCTPRGLATGCRDRGPRWPWLREAVEKPALAGPGLTDAALLRALLGPPAASQSAAMRSAAAEASASAAR